MTSWSAHPILAYTTVTVAPAPALSGLSLTVAAGFGALFGAAFPIQCLAWPTAVISEKTNAEVFTVSARVGDVLTISARAQQGTTARAIVVGDQIIASITPKDFTDLEAAVNVLEGLTPAALYVAAPATATSAGTRGQWSYAAGYMYKCYDTNLWRRWAATSF